VSDSEGLTGSRSQRLRRRDRKVFYWSLVAAVAIHVAVVLLVPTFHPESVPVPEAETEPGRPVLARPILVQAVFGPPTLAGPEEHSWTEPPERVLDAQRLVLLEGSCMALARNNGPAVRGELRLHVGWAGHARVLHVTESTGYACSDEVLKELGGALRYHWLPNERFPAPLELDQPIQLMEAEAPVGWGRPPRP